MSGDALVSLVVLAGWLVVVASAVLSLRLGAGRLLRLALIWLAIFLSLYLLVSVSGA